MNEQNSAICFEHVSFAYEMGQTVLKDVNFQIERGSFCVVIGSNGLGKSTLIQLMLGLLQPQSGKVEIMGHAIEQHDFRGQVAYIPQKATSLNSAFPATVQEVVSTGFFYQQKRFSRLSQQQKQKLNSTLELVGLVDSKKKRIGELSGGQQQRAFLARALVGSCQYLFLDEATSGIDENSTTALCCLLADISREQGVTIVMITHNFKSIRAHAQQIIRILPDHSVQVFAANEIDRLAEVMQHDE